jgi:hypothetical protein
LYNNHDLGSYLVQFLREYPDSSDSRVFPFQSFLDQFYEARQSYDDFRKFLLRNDFNLVLETLPKLSQIASNQFVDAHHGPFPRADWALVHFDGNSVIYLRRIPENQDLIRRFEYKTIYRNTPPDAPLMTSSLNTTYLTNFENEVDRCLSEDPKILYCLIGKASILEKTGRLKEAVGFLTQAQAGTEDRNFLQEKINTLRAAIGNK